MKIKHFRLGLFVLLAGGMLATFACKKTVQPEPEKPSDYRVFNSISDFNAVIDKLVALPDSLESQKRLNDLFDSLRFNNKIPFVLGDSVVFLYNGSGSVVSWAGDFNGWSATASSWQGMKLGKSRLWRLTKTFPPDARLDYKIVINGNWILDPGNSFVQYSGFGPNSELRMPAWVYPQETKLLAGATRGTLSSNQLIVSSPANLNYSVHYKVYTPFNYSQLNNLPVIYVTDGHEYADDRLGSMIIVLDNLIFQNKIPPVIAVFIDPRNPTTGANRRMDEYRANIKFANFVADELVVAVDNAYKTNQNASKRAILGTSLGGWNAAYFGMMRSDKFGLIGIHSPATNSTIVQNYINSPLLPLKIYLSTGVIFDTQTQALAMRQAMINKGYPLLYKEVNEGHSWGNWRALIDEPLIYFFAHK